MPAIASKYTLRILGDKDFFKVARGNPRYANVDEDNMGFADPEKNTIYVRDQNWPELNRYLIGHELDHLFEEKGTDEDENGIRHKKFFKQVLAPIALPILGSLIGGPIGGALAGGLGSTVGGALGAAAGGFGGQKIAGAPTGQALTAGGISALGSVAAPAIGKALGGAAKSVTGAFGGRGTPSITGSPATPASRLTSGSITPPAGTALTRGISTGSVIPQTNAQMQSSRVFNPLLRNLPTSGGPTPPTPVTANALAPASGLAQVLGAGQAGAGTQTGAQAGTQSGISKFFSSPLGQLALPLATAGLGNVFGKTPQMPDFSSLESIQALKSGTPGSLSEAGRLGMSRLTERLQSPAQLSALAPAQEDLIKRAFDRERQRTMAQFKLVQPDASLPESSQFRQAMFELDQQESDAMLNAQREDLSRQFQDIQLSLGLDAETMGQLASIAQLDLYQIMTKYQVDAQVAQNIKNPFSQFGSLLGQNATSTPGTTASQASQLPGTTASQASQLLGFNP